MSLGNIISAASSLVGGLLNKKSEAQARADTKAAAAEERAQQKEFAQQGIQWRVADAQAAGVHPLYALGASIPTYTPSASVFQADRSMGDALSAMGQDVGRAVNSVASPGDKVKVAMDGLLLERAGLENELLRSQIRRVNAPGTGVGVPGGDRQFIDGQGSLAGPSGDLYSVGKGASAQQLEDEYGDVMPEFENTARYLRDRFIPFLKKDWARTKKFYRNKFGRKGARYRKGVHYGGW